MKRVAVLGGGPAGAFAAAQLASAGVSTILFDEKLAWEKPCGGGLTFKAYNRYPFLLKNETPKKLIHETVLSTSEAGGVTLHLREPLLIYSRYELNRFLLARAERAGAQIEKTRVLELQRNGCGWHLRTTAGIAAADFCIVATGARNALRDVGTQLTSADAMTALGYYVPGEQNRIDVHFPPNFEGYIWVFPRCGHLSVGICGKRETATSLKRRLEEYMREREIAWTNAKFYAHLLPCLESRAWRHNRIAGERWLAVGDAAGLVDPITGEGLYYAIRSADLATRALLQEEPDQAAKSYSEALQRDFGADLEFASRIAARFYRGTYLFGGVTARMVQFTRHSGRFRTLMQDLFAGTQPYLGLRQRLMKQLKVTLLEVAVNAAFGSRNQ
jgi:geranylgeranyl reductase family protein